MRWIAARTKWILLVSGLLTLTMIQAAIAPQAALRSMFGATLDGPVAEVVVRSWGALIALVGAMLVYAAFRPAVRPLVLTAAGASKLVFVGLVLTYGRPLLGHQVGVSVAVDSLMVALFSVCLLAGRTGPDAARPT